MAKFNNTIMLSHAEVAQLIAAVGHKRTVLVEGENGIGKSDLLETLKTFPQFKNHLFPKPIDCAQLDVGDHSIPYPNVEKGVMTHLPNERYGVHAKNQKGVNGSLPVVLMLDEMAKMPKHLQATMAPLFFVHRLGNYILPDFSVTFGTTNLSVEALGDFMPAHTRNRIIIVRLRKPTAKEWMANFAIPNNLAAEVIGFVDQFPQVMASFIDYEPGGAHHGKDLSKDNPYIFNPRVQQDAYATPRSLHAVSDIIKEGANLPLEVVQAAINGTVGVPTGSEISAFLRFGRSLPTYERIIADPENTPLPENPTAQIVLVYRVVTMVEDRVQGAKIIKYVKRMRDEMSALFCNVAASDASKVSKFACNEEFGAMLDHHQIYFKGSQ